MSVQPGSSVDRFTSPKLQAHEQTMARGAVPARKTQQPTTAREFSQRQKKAAAMRDPHGLANTQDVASKQAELRQGSSVDRFHTPQQQQQVQSRSVSSGKSQGISR
jgi:hypothetical protein